MLFLCAIRGTFNLVPYGTVEMAAETPSCATVVGSITGIIIGYLNSYRFFSLGFNHINSEKSYPEFSHSNTFISSNFTINFDVRLLIV
jgi:hypothetical protein